ncbi:alpha/beta hydrolase [Nocardioides conyzicola]|uniref:alpha/beta fold hydrolase n=1 Tax=Nocardioides conyzicola TaxID=1651781 RepID=UPI0031EAB8D3
MPYVDLLGHPSYHEIVGAGEPLMLLHGGYCSIEHLRPLGDALADTYRVHAPERVGHGRTADRDGPFSYAAGLEETVAYLDAVGLASAHVVGFSDGAILGLLLALEHPGRVRSLVSISGNVDTDAFVSDEEAAHTMTAEASAQLDREYADLSPDGPEHGEVVVAKLTQMWLTEPRITPEVLATITAPTLVMAGDHDMVRPDHTLLIAQSIPGAQLAIVPGAGHLVAHDRPTLVGLTVREFLDAHRG